MNKKIVIGILGAVVLAIAVIALIPITGIFNSTEHSPNPVQVKTVPVDKVQREH